MPPVNRDEALRAVQGAIAQHQRDGHSSDWWRSLEELADSGAMQQWTAHEFPHFADLLTQSVDRRSALQLMAASLTLAGLSGCGPADVERLVPYVEMPENTVPGTPLYFATTLAERGFGMGVLATSHTGRPTKIEGNPQHPASLGASTPAMQASVLELYDPARSRTPLQQGTPASWLQFERQLLERLQNESAEDGAGLATLLPATTSPTIKRQLAGLQARLPGVRWYVHEPVAAQALSAQANGTGQPLLPVANLEQAAVILSFDADFLADGPAQLQHARHFARGRRVDDEQPERAAMSRLYVAEPTPSITGAAADHRWPVSARELESFVNGIASRVLNAGNAMPSPGDARMDAVAADLIAHRGRSVILAGASQPATVHRAVQAMNVALQNVGNTVHYMESPLVSGGTLAELVNAMNAGQVRTLLMLDVNPVYTAAADLAFARALQQVPFRVHLGLYEDETAAACHWHLPRAHDLESWGDLRAFDGTASLQQPLIAPLYNGRTTSEILALLDTGQAGGGEPEDTWSLVRQTWRPFVNGGDFEQFWRSSLHAGVIAGTRYPPVAISGQADWRPGKVALRGSGIEALFRPDPTIGDGRHSANAWLQELPKPLTKLTWENAVLVSPAMAAELAIENGQLVQLARDGRTIEAPAWIMPGQAASSITLFLGYGRQRTAPLGVGIGYDAYHLRPDARPWQVDDVTITVTDRHATLATTQHHHALEGWDLVRNAGVDDYRERGGAAFGAGREAAADAKSLYPEPGPGADPGGKQAYHWGMSIDLNACIGCNACVVACQAENNIPVVGKAEVARGREMHWIRVDRYFAGTADAPATAFQPVPCMHCENAPCEYVCPVGATQHSPEGLNEMVYNRCIGTRYCSQNCPYKVRRFNWFDVPRAGESPIGTPPAVYNPDVSVRVRGVMEKCTYCVQRINRSRIEARKDGRLIRDGELQTACQQSCPAEAIRFGNIRDEESAVSLAKQSPRNYTLLPETNTRPRTSYLAALQNPNPALSGSHTQEDNEPDGHDV